MKNNSHEPDTDPAGANGPAGLAGQSDTGPTRRLKALVTGASRGIGRGIALVLAEAGYDVAISYVTRADEAEQVAAIIREAFQRQCVVFQADTGKPGIAAHLVEQAIAALGGLDLLVNNAGVCLFDAGIVEDNDMIDRLIDIDFKGSLKASFAAARYMIDHHVRGSIINITSSRAERSYPTDAVYGGMKAALKRATETLALKYAPYGIRVNCVAPGATAVRDDPASQQRQELLGRKIPLGRIGVPVDMGHAVAFLASDKASYITGVTLRVDGGLILAGMPEDTSPEAGYGWGKINRHEED